MIDVRSAEGASLFVFGLILNQGMPAARAWQVPEHLVSRLGGRELWRFTDAAAVRIAMLGPPALHRFPSSMAGNLASAACRIRDCLDGDASRIWAPGCDADKVLDELCRFSGIGDHKARIGLLILTHEYGVRVLRGGNPATHYAHSCPGLSPALPLLEEAH